MVVELSKLRRETGKIVASQPCTDLDILALYAMDLSPITDNSSFDDWCLKCGENHIRIDLSDELCLTCYSEQGIY